MDAPKFGICCDAAHSTKNGITEFRAHIIETGEQILYRNLGNQTVNIGEFFAIIDCLKYIIENGYEHPVVYSDSIVAITWVKNKKTGSKKKNNDLRKAEVFLKVMTENVDRIQVLHWDNSAWGEIISDFGNK